jgi:uncharacterized protein (DUF1501 family)
MNRREILGAAAALPLMIESAAWAAPEAGNTKFLLVFLRGGYDCLSAVAPTGNAFYAQARPNIRIAPPDPNPDIANNAFGLDSDWSLHPALAASLAPMWRARQLAFVPFAGCGDMSRSHFETQDTIELGQANGERNWRSGFLNRLVAEMGPSKPVAFSQQLPLSFQGPTPAPNIAVSAIGRSALNPRQTQIIEQMYAGSPLAQAVSEGFSVRDEAYASISTEMVAANRGAPGPQGFELAARRVGRLMTTDFNVAFIDLGGWDTHVNQGAATGYLAQRLGELGRGLAALSDEMGPAWRNTTIVVISEFGRTFRENGARGTDHGHGSCYWVLGGAVSGGVIAGNQIAIRADTLNEGRDLPVLTDYRALLGGVFSKLYGLSNERLGRVFPEATPLNLQLV